MPKQLLTSASELQRYQIVSFHRTNAGNYWENCVEDEPIEQDDAYADRSRVITTSDNILLADEINKQAKSADSIDIVVSFILSSGLNLIIDSIRDFTNRGKKLRVITTTYMGYTEYEAIDQLLHLQNTELKVELTTGDRRLHAKAFLFKRNDGTGVVYVGSANISKSALTTGEEWVVKLRETDLKEPVEDVSRAFETLWNSPQYTQITTANRASVEKALGNNRRGN